MSPFVPAAILGGRYRLDRRVEQTGGATPEWAPDGVTERAELWATEWPTELWPTELWPTELWAATDEVLARRVIVEALPDGADEPTRLAFTAAAAAAARLIHPGIVSTYDTGTLGTTPYVVTEYPGGPSLATVLQGHGGLPAGRVVQLGRQLARALDAAHHVGVTHGEVAPPAILVSDDDRIKLGRFAAAGMRARLAGTSHDAAVRADIAGCGLALVAALLGRLPAAAAAAATAAVTGAEAAVGGAGRPISARALRAGVPRSLDEILVAAQAGRIPDATGLVTALDGLDMSDDATPIVVRDRTPPTGLAAVSAGRTPARSHRAPPTPLPGTTTLPAPTPRARPGYAGAGGGRAGGGGGRGGAVAGIVIGVLLAVAVAVAAFVLTAGDRSSGGPNGSPSAALTPGEGPGGSLAVAGGYSFNPLGTGPEHSELVPNLFDGDPSTLWTTETYDSPQFGGLKSGTGVVLNLTGQHDLHQLTVTSPSRGWAFSVYVARQSATALTGWGQPVANVATVDADVTQVELGEVQAGSILVWITRLTDSPPYRVAIGEITVR